MDTFIQQIAQGVPYASEKVEGYSEVEIAQLERLYDIEIKGNFCQFMREMGRCDGGLMGDDPIILYRPTMSVRNFVVFQAETQEDIYAAGATKLAAQKPFAFSIESETQVFFIATRSAVPDEVYHLDENTNEVKSTNMLFNDYLRRLVRHYGGPGIVCRGEMLVI